MTIVGTITAITCVYCASIIAEWVILVGENIYDEQLKNFISLISKGGSVIRFQCSNILDLLVVFWIVCYRHVKIKRLLVFVNVAVKTPSVKIYSKRNFLAMANYVAKFSITPVSRPTLLDKITNVVQQIWVLHNCSVCMYICIYKELKKPD